MYVWSCTVCVDPPLVPRNLIMKLQLTTYYLVNANIPQALFYFLLPYNHLTRLRISLLDLILFKTDLC